MITRISLVAGLVFANFAYAGQGVGIICQDAAKAAARQEAYNIVKYQGIDGKKVTAIQTLFSAKFVSQLAENDVQKTFTDKIAVEFSTPQGTHGTMMLEVQGIWVGNQCAILTVNDNVK